MPAKIVHLSSAHPVYDTRIFFKECMGAASAGFEVYYVVTGTDSHEARGVHIVGAGPYRKSRLRRMVFSAWQVYRAALRLKADLYHFHDPELLPAGFLLKLRGRKVVYDVHEDVAADILDKQWIHAWIRKPLAAAFDAIEKILARRFDAVVTVTDEIAARFHRSRRVALVRNFPVIALVDGVRPAVRQDEKYTVIYSGLITRHRGIVPLLQAMEKLGSSVALVMIGRWEDEALEAECRALPGFVHVRYKGQVPQEASLAEMKAADAGIINFLPIPNHVTALPNKPFEYMACGLPMIMSGFDAWKKRFDGCALFVDPADATDIASGIRMLAGDAVLSKKLGTRGLELARASYSWEAESKTLTRLYHELLNP